MATLGAKKRRSTQAAPTRAWGQSTTTTRSGVSSRLSARRSRCSSVSPAATFGAPASRPARRSRLRADQPSSPAGRSRASFPQCPPAMTDHPSTPPTVRTSSGDGVRSSARAAMASSARSSSPGHQGSVGLLPSTCSKRRSTQPSSPSPWDQRRRGTGASGGSMRTTSASLRWAAGESGLGSGPMALTKTRRPPEVRSRAATPGENPPGEDAAATTLSPSCSSTARRTRDGTSAQRSRTPAAGALGAPRRRPGSEHPPALWHLDVGGEEDHLAVLVGNAQDEDLALEASDPLRRKVDDGDHLLAHQRLRVVVGRELGAGPLLPG